MTDGRNSQLAVKEYERNRSPLFFQESFWRTHKIGRLPRVDRPMLRPLLLFGAALLLAISPLPAAESSRIVFMIGEDEYHTWETLPEFAEKDLKPRGYRIDIIHADAADKNHFPGLTAALREADLLFLSVRRRTPLKEELHAVRAYLAEGKPLIGIRTASHAFALRPKDKQPDPKFAIWQEFDPEILGGHYTGHYGKDRAVVSLVPGAESHPILKDISIANLQGNGGLYKVSPLNSACTPLLLGTLPGHPAEPVAWTYAQGARKGRVFYTSMGHADDFKIPDFRRFLLNAVQWALGGS
jgi:type 1 glutamine amidotransferase